MTTSSSGGGGGGSRFDRFIPAEEISRVAQWQFGAVDETVRAAVALAARIEAVEAEQNSPQVQARMEQARAEAHAQGYAEGHARAALEGAQRLDDYVGGAGRLMSLLAQAAPHLADKVSARFGEAVQLGDPGEPAADNLHAPGEHRIRHEAGDAGRRSLYTRATLDPNSPLAAATAASGALFDLALSILAPRKK